MFDGSHYDIDENKAKTEELLLAHDKGVSIEVNRFIGGEEDGVVGAGECNQIM